MPEYTHDATAPVVGLDSSRKDPQNGLEEAGTDKKHVSFISKKTKKGGDRSSDEGAQSQNDDGSAEEDA